MNQSINTDSKNSKEPQQKYRLGTVSIKILGGGLKPVLRAPNVVCLDWLILNDVSLLRNIVFTQKLEFNLHNRPKRTNFLKSISASIGNVAKRPKAISVRVRTPKDCICLMQNRRARSSVSNSADDSADQISHPYKALGTTTAL